MTIVPQRQVRRFARLDAGRGLACLMLVVGVAVVSGLIAQRGWKQGWQAWGVSAREPAWIDTRVITAGVLTRAEGGNPYVDNLHDPARRPFNYPPIWLSLLPARLSEPGYATFALGSAGVALISLLVWIGPLGALEGILLGALLLSPAALLAVERGNTDLIVFALTALGLACLGHPGCILPLAGIATLFCAAMLKFYPVAALGVVAVFGPARFRKAAMLAMLAFAVSVALQWDAMRTGISNTQIGAVHSYGRNVLPFCLELMRNFHGWNIDRLQLEDIALAMTAACAAFAAWQGSKLGPPEQSLPVTQHCGALTGAGIYLVTFAAGSSFQYRLWFALLTLPWLLQAAGTRSSRGTWARLALVSLTTLMFASSVWWVPLVWIGQAAGWLLFVAQGVLTMGLLSHELRRLAPSLTRLRSA